MREDILIRNTIKELESFGVSGTLSNVVITRIGPWTMSYVRYDDDTIGYGPTSAFYPEVLFEKGVDISLPIILPNTPDFQRQFALSRGYWYPLLRSSMRDVKQRVIKRR